MIFVMIAVLLFLILVAVVMQSLVVDRAGAVTLIAAAIATGVFVLCYFS